MFGGDEQLAGQHAIGAQLSGRDCVANLINHLPVDRQTAAGWSRHCIGAGSAAKEPSFVVKQSVCFSRCSALTLNFFLFGSVFGLARDLSRWPTLGSLSMAARVLVTTQRCLAVRLCQADTQAWRLPPRKPRWRTLSCCSLVTCDPIRTLRHAVCMQEDHNDGSATVAPIQHCVPSLADLSFSAKCPVLGRQPFY